MIGEIITRRGYLATGAGAILVRAEGENEDEEKMGIPFVFSTEDEASDGHVLLQTGWELDDYRANPVFLWGHDLGGGFFSEKPPSPPLGRVEGLEVKTDDSGRKSLEGRVVFASEIDPRTNAPFSPPAYEMEYLYKGGFVRAVSVGFRVLNATPRASLGKEHPLYAERGMVINRASLLEISGVPLGADKNALKKERSQPKEEEIAPVVPVEPSDFSAWLSGDADVSVK